MKSYFYGDTRKKVEDLLAEAASVDGIACATELEALVVEARMIREHEPKYNRKGRTWRRYAYLRVDGSEAYPRIKVVREPKGAGASSGRSLVQPRAPGEGGARGGLPDPSVHDADARGDPVRAVRARRHGRCVAPCDGRAGPERYGELVRSLISSLSTPGGLLGTLEARMRDLAEQERFEEAGLARDRPGRSPRRSCARDRTRGCSAAATSSCRDGAGRATAPRAGRWCAAEVRRRSAAPVPAGPGRRALGAPGVARAGEVTVDAAEVPLAEPVAGGAELHRLLGLAARDARAVARTVCARPPIDWAAVETAVIVEGARTPIGRFLGSYAELPAVDLGVLAAKEAMRRSVVEPDAIDQTILGHARQAGTARTPGAR